MPREDLISKPGELPTFSLIMLIAQKRIGIKIQPSPTCSGLLHWPEEQFLQILFHVSVIWRYPVYKSEPWVFSWVRSQTSRHVHPSGVELGCEFRTYLHVLCIWVATVELGGGFVITLMETCMSCDFLYKSLSPDHFHVDFWFETHSSPSGHCPHSRKFLFTKFKNKLFLLCITSPLSIATSPSEPVVRHCR